MQHLHTVCTYYFIITVSVPIIISHPGNVTTPVHTTATFTCKVKSSTNVKITWRKHGYSFPPAARIKVKKLRNEVISTLRITRVIGYYSGEYYCIARNKFGSVTSKSARLNIEGNFNFASFKGVCVP